MANITETLLRDIMHKRDLVRRPTDGDLERIEGLENLRQALLRRLVTSPGSLVHRPEYGVGIKDFQGSLNSLANQRKIAARINEQFLRDPRVESVDGVSISSTDSRPEHIVISVRYTVVGYGETEAKFIPFGEG